MACQEEQLIGWLNYFGCTVYLCLFVYTPCFFFAPSLFLSEAIQAFLSDEIENNKFMGCCYSSPAHAAFDLAVVFVVAIAVLHISAWLFLLHLSIPNSWLKNSGSKNCVFLIKCDSQLFYCSIGYEEVRFLSRMEEKNSDFTWSCYVASHARGKKILLFGNEFNLGGRNLCIFNSSLNPKSSKLVLTTSFSHGKLVPFMGPDLRWIQRHWCSDFLNVSSTEKGTNLVENPTIPIFGQIKEIT